MELKGSKTEEILMKAFAREAQANARYLYFAAAAREAGFKEIADMFLATAQNEAEHARYEFGFLGGIRDTGTNLKLAVNGEHEEATRLYPEAAKIAEGESFTEIADFFRRMAKVEEKHYGNFLELLETLDRNGTFKGRTVGHSAIEMAEVMLPHQANPAGFVHGGELMKLADNAAGVVAARHSRANIVTGRVEDIIFHNAARVGQLVVIRGKIVFASRSSMTVRIEVEAEDIRAGKRLLALTAYFVMVALNAEGRPAEVPPLLINTEEEEKLFNEGLVRYQSHRKEAS